MENPHERKNVSSSSSSSSSSYEDLRTSCYCDEVTVHAPNTEQEKDCTTRTTKRFEYTITVESASEELKIIFSLEKGSTALLELAFLVSTGLVGTARGSSMLLHSVNLGSSEDVATSMERIYVLSDLVVYNIGDSIYDASKESDKNSGRHRREERMYST
eukprot:TRINITY_DN1520_c0_g1_i3.p1 TRINITY_DN1520_c0_g1~~TRINITY_DN1520_c0_g1_i3.p1  ORF type:complete len:159 (-),score=36.56 TRINITY_DN1520_c0_g1_i3:432-908(-)